MIPRTHVENVDGLTPEDGRAVWELTQRVAVGIRSAYGCEGTSIRQHNEPAGDPDVWDLHVHVFPRYETDDLYRRHDQARWVAPDARESYAMKLREVLGVPFFFEDAITPVDENRGTHAQVSRGSPARVAVHALRKPVLVGDLDRAAIQASERVASSWRALRSGENATMSAATRKIAAAIPRLSG